MTGDELLALGQYEQAITILSQPIPEEDELDTFRTGRVYSLAVAKLLAGRFVDADEFTKQELIEQSPHSISSHALLIAWRHWFAGEHAESLKWILRATKCGYCNKTGLDGASALYYVSLRDPSIYCYEDAIARLQKVANRLISDNYPGKCARLLLGEIEERYLIETADEGVRKHGQRWTELISRIVHFYLALAALRANNYELFVERIQNAAKPGIFDVLEPEIIIARLEVLTNFDISGKGYSTWMAERAESKGQQQK